MFNNIAITVFFHLNYTTSDHKQVEKKVGSMENIKLQMNAYIDGLYDDLIGMSDAIFDHPETGNQEYFASKLLTDWLKAQGFTVELGLGSLDTAFRAVYEQGEGGPSIGLLAEYDALKGIGHACGHHMQGPCLLGAAAAIKNAGIKDPFKLVVYGTPAEEGGRGKREMIQEGCFKCETSLCKSQILSIRHQIIRGSGVNDSVLIQQHVHDLFLVVFLVKHAARVLSLSHAAGAGCTSGAGFDVEVLEVDHAYLSPKLLAGH